jgi:hypothetical protein
VIEFVTLMMDAVRTSETSVFCNDTALRSTPEGSHLDNRRRENLKSHTITKLLSHHR